MIDLKTLVKNGVHFGHQTSRWSPKMEPYIWGQKNNIHLIDVSKTARLLDKAASFLEATASEGKPILWVGTKKAAHDIIERVGCELEMPYVVNRWVGCTLTNYRQVKKSVANMLHYYDVLDKSDSFNYSKKELSIFQKRAEKLEASVGGLRKLTWPVGAIVVVDIKKENVVIKEALAMGIPVVALVDTNCDPSGIDYVIPANDDAPRSINLLVNYLADSAKKGLTVAQKRHQEEQIAEEEQRYMLELESEEEAAKKPAKKAAAVKARPKAKETELEQGSFKKKPNETEK
ncbi:MAG: 30S ribosomal protein S2 [Candidatus Amoebophilus sp.]